MFSVFFCTHFSSTRNAKRPWVFLSANFHDLRFFPGGVSCFCQEKREENQAKISSIGIALYENGSIYYQKRYM